MTQYSFDDIIRMDQDLHQLAMYEVTKGMIVIPKSQDEFIDLQTKIANTFNYFKGLIQKKECTFEYIQKTVLEKNGPIPKSDPLDIDKIDINDLDKAEQDNQKNKVVNSFVQELLRSIIPAINQNSSIGQNSNDNNDNKQNVDLKFSIYPLDAILPKSKNVKKTPSKKTSRNKKKTKKQIDNTMGKSNPKNTEK